MTVEQPVRSVADLDTTVVDADFHLTEGTETVLPYVEEPFEKMLAGSSSYSGGVDPYPSAGLFHPSVATGRTRVFNETELSTPADVRDGMELLGVDRAPLDPGGQLSLGMVHHDQVAAALANAYNEYLLDTFLDGEELYGSAVVAPQRPDLAAAEIDDRAGERGIVAVFLPSGGVTPPLGDRRYDPIYEAAAANDLPILLHNVAGGAMTSFPVQYQAFDRHMPTHVVSHPMHHMVTLTHMLTTGVPERFPDLTVVFQEAGLGWIPYMMNRLDYEFYGQRQDAPLLEKPPSEYVDDQFYFTSQPVEGADKAGYVAETIRQFGGERNLMFASDYPHHDFDHADDVLRHLTAEFDREEIEAMFGGTAMEVYDF